MGHVGDEAFAEVGKGAEKRCVVAAFQSGACVVRRAFGKVSDHVYGVDHLTQFKVNVFAGRVVAFGRGIKEAQGICARSWVLHGRFAFDTRPTNSCKSDGGRVARVCRPRKRTRRAFRLPPPPDHRKSARRNVGGASGALFGAAANPHSYHFHRNKRRIAPIAPTCQE